MTLEDFKAEFGVIQHSEPVTTTLVPSILDHDTPPHVFVAVDSDGKACYMTFTEDGRIVPLDN